jgi:integrase
MASIRKRILPSGDTRWLVDYRDRAGGRRAKQFRSKAEAVSYETKVRSAIAGGTHVPDSQSVTVGKAADLWVAAGERDRLEATTVRQRRQHVDLHIKPLIGVVKLSELTAPAVQAFANELLESRSRSMARRIVTSLKGVISEAQRSGLVGQNVALIARVGRGRTEREEEDRVVIPPKDHLKLMLRRSADLWPLTRKDARDKLVTCCWRPLIVTAIFSGMRASELRGLAWSSVDFEAASVYVRQRADRYNRLGPPKSKAGRRTIPMAPIVSNTLKEWKLACPASTLDLVFPSERREILWHTNLYQQCFIALLEACGLMLKASEAGGKSAARAAPGIEEKEEAGSTVPPYNFHALRHAAASLFIEHGWTPKKVQTIMGHSSIQVTFDIYGHLYSDPVDDAKAMAQIETRLLA